MSAQPDLFEVSLGYNYIHLGDTAVESKNLHGLDVSAFVNLNSWLALGGDFMADFGHRTQRFFFADVDIDNQRYVYVFGPRVTVWQNPQFKVFVEALAGGVSADVQASVGSLSQSASDNGFAMATGAGFDWRFSRHFSASSRAITSPHIWGVSGRTTSGSPAGSSILSAEGNCDQNCSHGSVSRSLFPTGHRPVATPQALSSLKWRLPFRAFAYSSLPLSCRAAT